MEINGHLNETELAEFVLNPAPAVGSHLELCDKCLDEVTRLRDLVHGLRRRSSGEEDEEFWTTQQRAIRTRIVSQTARPSSTGRRLAWAMATATMAIATVLVLGGQAPAPKTAPQAKVDPDHELLLEVERSLQTGGPEALEPAGLLAREIGQQLTTNDTSQNNKENTHED